MYINNTSLCYNTAHPGWGELLVPGCNVSQRQILTVDCNLNLALIGRSHSIVGDAFVVLSLLPFNLCDVQELPLTHQPIWWHKREVEGHHIYQMRGDSGYHLTLSHSNIDFIYFILCLRLLYALDTTEKKFQFEALFLCWVPVYLLDLEFLFLLVTSHFVWVWGPVSC